MRNAFRWLALVLGVVTIVSAIGCSSGSKEVAPGKERSLSMMQVLPANTSAVSFLDVYVLRTDENLEAEWTGIKGAYFGNDSTAERINGWVSTDNISIFEGDITLDQFMKLMEITGDTSYSYGGHDVRMGLYSLYNLSAVIINGSALVGFDEDVRRCIDVANGNESSLYGNEDIRAVMNLLPSGYELGIWIIDNSSSSEEPAGLLVAGASMTKDGEDYIATEIYKFDSPESARQYVATADNVSEDGTMQIARTQDGVFVTELMTPLTETPEPTDEPISTPEPTIEPTPAP